MRAKLKLMRVGTDGTIHNSEWIDDRVIRKISVEETVGDEFWVKSSEIKIEIAEKLPLILVLPLLEQWIALYYDDVLFNVYKHPGQDSWLSQDHKTGIYQYRLYPLQKIFYDHLKATALEYSTTATEWNYGLEDALVEIHEIEIHNDLGAPLSTTDRWGFAIPLIVETLLDKHNGYSYKIGGITHTMITPNDDDLAIIWRGSSKDATGIDTEQEMINFTFKQSDLGGGEVFDMTWLDIFKLIIFGWNSFILVTPSVDTGVLLANIDILPKVNLDEDSPIPEADVKFLERKKIRERYKIGGVSLTGLNFSWSTGDLTAGNIISRSFDIADYSEPVEGFSVTLYWGAGDYNSGDGQYELTAPYFGTGLVAPYYLDLTTDGSGYEVKSKLLYDDGGTTKILRPLDQIEIKNEDGSTEIFHITTIRADGEGIAQIEGMVIYP